MLFIITPLLYHASTISYISFQNSFQFQYPQVPERGEAALSASIHGASTVTSPVITRSVHNTVSNSLSAFLKRTQFNSSSSSSSADDCDTDTSAS